MICASNRSKDFPSHMKMICTSNRSKDLRSSINILRESEVLQREEKQSYLCLVNLNIFVCIYKFEYLCAFVNLNICLHIMFFFTRKSLRSSCSIFKLHPGTFSFSIISDIFQAIFINSNSYQINWQNTKIHVCTKLDNKVFSLPLKDKCDPHGRFTAI